MPILYALASRRAASESCGSVRGAPGPSRASRRTDWQEAVMRPHFPTNLAAQSSAFARRLLAVALAVATVAVAMLSAAPAQAKNIYTLDRAADSSGPIVVDSAGNGYVTWLRTGATSSLPDSVMFCKIPANGRCKTPMTLALPAATDGADDGTSQPYVVLAPGNQVWVIAPRYVLGDIVIWLSQNGGANFNPAVDVTAPNDYAGETSVDGVLLEPSEPFIGQTPPVAYFDIASNNPGLGYSWLPTNLVAGGSEATSFQFANPGAGGVGGATIGEQPNGFPLEAYWNLSSPAQVFYYRQTAPNGSVAALSDAWTSTSTLVGDGYLPALASGPKGLFLAYEGYPASNFNDTPSVLEFTAYNATTGTFGTPKALVTDPQADTSLHDGGTIDENATTGEIGVLWPKFGEAGGVMRLWTSEDAGTQFTARGTVAKFGGGYSGTTNLALNAKGGGFLTYQDSAGLQLADLAPVTKAKRHKKH
jgi:hypothetical protein